MQPANKKTGHAFAQQLTVGVRGTTGRVRERQEAQEEPEAPRVRDPQSQQVVADCLRDEPLSSALHHQRGGVTRGGCAW